MPHLLVAAITNSRLENVLSSVRFSIVTIVWFAVCCTSYSITGAAARESAYRVSDHARAAKKSVRKKGGFSLSKKRRNREPMVITPSTMYRDRSRLGFEGAGILI
jgi:hypothetical protein